MALTRVLGDAGFVLWKYKGSLFQHVEAGGDPLVYSFGYLIPYRERPTAIGGGVAELRIFWYLVSILWCLDVSNRWIFVYALYKNPLYRSARTAGGMDLVIRVIVIGHEGKNHLKILNRIARGKAALHSTNHSLPLYQQFVFEDIVFGVFPKIGAWVFYMVGRWAKNSLGDVLEMAMRMLEVRATRTQGLTRVISFSSGFIWHCLYSFQTCRPSCKRDFPILKVFVVDVA